MNINQITKHTLNAAKNTLMAKHGIYYMKLIANSKNISYDLIEFIDKKQKFVFYNIGKILHEQIEITNNENVKKLISNQLLQNLSNIPESNIYEILKILTENKNENEIENIIKSLYNYFLNLINKIEESNYKFAEFHYNEKNYLIKRDLSILKSLSDLSNDKYKDKINNIKSILKKTIENFLQFKSNEINEISPQFQKDIQNNNILNKDDIKDINDFKNAKDTITFSDIQDTHLKNSNKDVEKDLNIFLESLHKLASKLIEENVAKTIKITLDSDKNLKDDLYSALETINANIQFIKNADEDQKFTSDENLLNECISKILKDIYKDMKYEQSSISNYLSGAEQHVQNNTSIGLDIKNINLVDRKQADVLIQERKDILGKIKLLIDSLLSSNKHKIISDLQENIKTETKTILIDPLNMFLILCKQTGSYNYFSNSIKNYFTTKKDEINKASSVQEIKNKLFITDMVYLNIKNLFEQFENNDYLTDLYSSITENIVLVDNIKSLDKQIQEITNSTASNEEKDTQILEAKKNINLEEIKEIYFNLSFFNLITKINKTDVNQNKKTIITDLINIIEKHFDEDIKNNKLKFADLNLKNLYLNKDNINFIDEQYRDFLIDSSILVSNTRTEELSTFSNIINILLSSVEHFFSKEHKKTLTEEEKKSLINDMYIINKHFTGSTSQIGLNKSDVEKFYTNNNKIIRDFFNMLSEEQDHLSNKKSLQIIKKIIQGIEKDLGNEISNNVLNSNDNLSEKTRNIVKHTLGFSFGSMIQNAMFIFYITTLQDLCPSSIYAFPIISMATFYTAMFMSKTPEGSNNKAQLDLNNMFFAMINDFKSTQNVIVLKELKNELEKISNNLDKSISNPDRTSLKKDIFELTNDKKLSIDTNNKTNQDELNKFSEALEIESILSKSNASENFESQLEFEDSFKAFLSL